MTGSNRESATQSSRDLLSYSVASGREARIEGTAVTSPDEGLSSPRSRATIRSAPLGNRWSAEIARRTRAHDATVPEIPGLVFCSRKWKEMPWWKRDRYLTVPHVTEIRWANLETSSQASRSSVHRYLPIVPRMM